MATRRRPEERDDPRALRVRAALLAAFGSLVVARPYDELRVADVVAHAGVARSTFYVHFRDKDALLRASIAGPFALLAALVDVGVAAASVERLIAHFAENRRRALKLLRGSAAPHLLRALRDLVLARLVARLPARRSRALDAAMAATQVAGAQLALLQAWLGEELRCPAATVARALRNAALTGARTLLPAG